VTSSLRRTREEAASPTATSATQTVLAIAVGAAPTSPSRGTPTTRPWLSVPSRSIQQMTGFDLDTTIQFGTKEPRFSGHVLRFSGSICRQGSKRSARPFLRCANPEAGSARRRAARRRVGTRPQPLHAPARTPQCRAPGTLISLNPNSLLPR
jgi:hypothetical protein